MIMQSLEKTLTVLFVDDDADEYYLFKEALEQSFLSVQILRAKDGRHLLTLLSGDTLPDIIFMDVNMPHKDGIETLSEIKANSQLSNIPVIIFSTSKNLAQINTCYQKGAHFYVVKPERFDDITRMVKKVFSVDWKTNVTQPSKQEFVIEYWALEASFLTISLSLRFSTRVTNPYSNITRNTMRRFALNLKG